ncbi:hypothetical protein CXB51_016328 [Gossypium anomalum]|uniref:Retroviral polymerase SH3-like domain-containing protein n=1 Tax=Gossypium anomalum TaxID=47600 RepID=A0A8J5YWD8_9ROSI|nr:hypothetical protein CXB51_016328 [Gossypium anomalum]
MVSRAQFNATNVVLTVDTPRHSTNVGEAVHSPGSGSHAFSTVHYFSKHDTIRLNEHNFLLWKHQLLLILEGYGLERFVLGTVSSPPFITGDDGLLVENPAFFNATDVVLTVDTPRHSTNVGEAVHSPGSGSHAFSTVHYFSKHDTIKLNEHNFLLWKHQLLLILEGYGLERFVLGTVSSPPFITGDDGLLVENPAFVVHKKQDKFLASWFLSTVKDDVLVHLTAAKTSFDIWTAISRRFGAKSNIKLSSMRHNLYSIKKSSLSIKDYLAKVKSLSDGLTTAGSPVTEQEQVSVILAGLPIEFDSIRILASATPMSLDLVTKMLLDCEARQLTLLTDVPLQVNLVSQKSDQDSMKASFDTSRGHIVQTCYHRFDENFSGFGSTSSPSVNYHHLNEGLTSHCSTSQCCATFSQSSATSSPVVRGPPGSLSTQHWYPDSGATNHVTPTLANLTDFLPIQALVKYPWVTFAKDNNVYFEFHPVLCFVKDIQTGKTLLVGHMHDGLYRFDFSRGDSCRSGSGHSQASSLLNNVQVRSSLDLWHNRLGHPCPNTDGGGEFRSLSNELARLGIQHRVTCSHISEQNGVVERRHRHIIEMGLTLLAKASMPLKYWTDAFSHAVFGSACFPHLRSFQQHKLQFRSSKCVFLGFGPHHKGYKCLAADGCVFISRHVLFGELEYPFQTGFSSSPDSESVKFSHQYSPVPVVAVSSSGSRLSCLRTAGLGSTPAAPDLGSPGFGSYPRAVSADENAPASREPSFSSDVPGATHDRPSVPNATSGRPSSPKTGNPMQTRSKSGIFKPKVFSPTLGEREPSIIAEAFQSSTWTAAAKSGFDALIAKGTWDLVPLPAGRRAAVVDFYETFSPVVKPTTVRVVLALAPPEFEQYSADGQQLVCRLRKALYGLKQAPCAWFHKLREFLLASGFVASKADNSIEVTRNRQGVFLGQRKYVLDLLRRASMDKSNSSPTPLITSCKMSAHEGTPYVVITRPDIAFSVNKACQFMHKPLDTHYKAIKRILRYLQGTLDFGLHFTPASKLLIEGYSDASWASDIDDRRGNPVSWSSRKQSVVSHSTAEAEYKSLAQVTTEMVWIRPLLSELGIPAPHKALLWCDSSAAVAVANNPVMHSKFKHVELDLFFVRERVADGSFQVGHISSQDQIADILTKPLSVGLFEKFRNKLRIVSKEE